MASLAQARRDGADQLRAGGIDTPDLDARVLLAAVAGMEPAEILLRGDVEISSPQQDAFAALVKRRLAGEPVARLRGCKEFWGLSFALAPSSLVPRADSETLVAAGTDYLRRCGLQHPRLLDLGTGPGTLLLSLLHDCPAAVGVGIDCNEETLQTARGNAHAFGVGARAHFMCGDWTKALAASKFDLIVSNPPYIRSADIAGLAREVRIYDPHLALDGGIDGLAAYRQILGQVRGFMHPESALLLEIGDDQDAAVGALAWAHGLEVAPDVLRDLSGRARVIHARLADGTGPQKYV